MINEHDKLAAAIEERDIARADLEKVVEYNTKLQEERDDAFDQMKRSKARADGHYQNYCQMLKRIDVVVKERDEARAEFNRLTKERDDARAEVEELKQAIAERTPHDYGILKEEAQEMRNQRDEALAEVEERKNALIDATYQIDNYKSKFLLWFENAKTQNTKLLDALEDATKARKELEQLKQALHDARMENSGQAMLLERKRPEPSRLEIAAQLMAANLSRDTNKWDTQIEVIFALEQADALIAAAKEGK